MTTLCSSRLTLLQLQHLSTSIQRSTPQIFPSNLETCIKVKISALMASLCQADGEVIIDSGAGRGIKPTMHGLVDPKSSSTRIVWGDGTSTSATTEASVPGHDLPPFLVAPKASGTLVSVGANTGAKIFATPSSTNMFSGLTACALSTQRMLKSSTLAPNRIQVQCTRRPTWTFSIPKKMGHGVSPQSVTQTKQSSRGRLPLQPAMQTSPQPLTQYLQTKHQRLELYCVVRFSNQILWRHTSRAWPSNSYANTTSMDTYIQTCATDNFTTEPHQGRP